MLQSDHNLPSWAQRPDVEVIEIQQPMIVDNDFIPLFDRLDQFKDEDSGDMSSMSLREISEAYLFSLSYLGDFCAQLGCNQPIDIDVPIRKILDEEKIVQVITAVTSLDPLDANFDYEGETIYDVAEEFDIPVNRVVDVCRQEKINLPFGKDTILHISEAQRLNEILQFDNTIFDDQL